MARGRRWRRRHRRVGRRRRHDGRRLLETDGEQRAALVGVEDAVAGAHALDDVVAEGDALARLVVENHELGDGLGVVRGAALAHEVDRAGDGSEGRAGLEAAEARNVRGIEGLQRVLREEERQHVVDILDRGVQRALWRIDAVARSDRVRGAEVDDGRRARALGSEVQGAALARDLERDVGVGVAEHAALQHLGAEAVDERQRGHERVAAVERRDAAVGTNEGRHEGAQKQGGGYEERQRGRRGAAGHLGRREEVVEAGRRGGE